MRSLAHQYHELRGTNPTGKPTGKKVAEEVIELVEAIAIGHDDDIMYEVGDVAISLSYVAECNGFTVEDAMRAKMYKDMGRGEKKVVANQSQ